jgi:hypothetical protein
MTRKASFPAFELCIRHADAYADLYGPELFRDQRLVTE